MKETAIKIQISDIFLDESIYPRENIDHKRIGIFVENLRDGHLFDPIQVQVSPDSERPESLGYLEKVWYRIFIIKKGSKKIGHRVEKDFYKKTLTCRYY